MKRATQNQVKLQQERMRQNQLKQQAFINQQRAIQAQQTIKAQANLTQRQQVAINHLHQSNVNHESEIQSLRTRIHDLEAENSKLKKENKELRQLIESNNEQK